MEVGGLGLRKMFETNQAFIAKLGWKMIQSPNELWVRQLHAKYITNDAGIISVRRTGVSWIWRGILLVQDFLKTHLCYLPRSGSQLHITLDPWIPINPNFRPISRSTNPVDPSIQFVADLVDQDLGGWNETILNSLFEEELT